MALVTALTLAAMESNADQTNLVRRLDVQLVGFKQGATTTNRSVVITSEDLVRVDERDLIRAIGTSMGTTFSRSAQLVLITPMAEGYSSIAIRDGSTSTDVSGFFGLADLSGGVTKAVVQPSTGRYQSQVRSLKQFTLADSGSYTALTLHYDLSGVALDVFSNGPRGFWGDFEAEVSGSGDRNGELMILRGVIRAEGNTFEVISSGGGGPNV